MKINQQLFQNPLQRPHQCWPLENTPRVRYGLTSYLMQHNWRIPHKQIIMNIVTISPGHSNHSPRSYRGRYYEWFWLIQNSHLFRLLSLLCRHKQFFKTAFNLYTIMLLIDSISLLFLIDPQCNYHNLIYQATSICSSLPCTKKTIVGISYQV